MTLEDKIHALRLHFLQRAEELDNVGEACRDAGSHERCSTVGKNDSRCTESMSCIVGELLRVRGVTPAGSTKERKIIAMALAWPAWRTPGD